LANFEKTTLVKISSGPNMKEEEIEKIEKKKPKKIETSLLHKKLNEYSCKDLKVINHINILLIGEKGAGKSSLISTFHRSLLNKYGEEPIAEVGTNLTSV
jgi:predicted GTPase